MKEKRLVTLLVLPLLVSCGGGESSSSLPPSSGNESSQGSSEDIFDRLDAAQKKTNEADAYRAYTPHANTNLDILENGYVNAAFGVRITDKSEDANSSPTKLNLELKKMPLDIRYGNRNAEENKDKLFSFANYIEDVDGKMSGTLGSYPFSNLSIPKICAYSENGDLYLDAYTLARQIRTITLGTVKLPYDGRVKLPAFDWNDIDEDKLREIFDGVNVDIPNSDTTFDVDNLIDFLPFLDVFGDFDLSKLVRSINTFDRELYELTGPKFWTFENENKITLSVKGEEELREFLLNAYDYIFEDIPVVGVEVPDKEESIDSFLDAVEFSSLTAVRRFNEKGIDYNKFAFEITSFNEEKFKIDEIEGVETSVEVLPYGKFALSYGLAYEYDNVEVERVPEKDKDSYTEIDYLELLEKVVDLIRDEDSEGEGDSSSTSTKGSAA